MRSWRSTSISAPSSTRPAPPAPLDPASLVVTEVDAGGNPLSGPLTVQFNADSPGASAGTLLFQLPGETPAGASRRALIEFDHSASAAFAPQVGPAGQVTVTDTVDEGQDAVQDQHPAGGPATAEAGRLVLQRGRRRRQGLGGLPPDRPVRRHLSWDRSADPLHDYFHPGGLLSSVTRDSGSSGPLKAVFNATSTNGWTQRFEVYPTFVRATVTPPAAAPRPRGGTSTRAPPTATPTSRTAEPAR